MRSSVDTPAGNVKIGDRIRILEMDDNAPSFAFSKGKDLQAQQYAGKEGVVQTIDDQGQIHGTWGGLAVIPEIDHIAIVSRS